MSSIVSLIDSGRTILRHQINDLLDFIYPPVCGLCGRPADSDDRLVCRSCWGLLTTIEEPFCLNCREFIQTGTLCRNCGDDALTVFSLGVYDDTLRSIIYDLKFGCLKPLGIAIGTQLSDIIGDKCQYLKFDMIVPVPLHESRLYLRGFNQAEVIGREIARGIGIPCRPEVLAMTRRTRQQARLTAPQREINVRGAYAVIASETVRGKSILIVDDITTTGATLREVARMLKKAGAGRVTAAVAATVV